MKKVKNEITVNSSAAQYLTFVSAAGENSVEVRYEDENIWLTQKMMSELYGVEVPTINYHLKKIFSDGELQEDSVIREFLITAADNKNYKTKHYGLQAVIAVGFKVDNPKAVQFRKWVIGIAKDYTIKGFVMDDERFKAGHKFTDKFFEEQLARIREIRASERKFYQKITDIYATAVDYDKTAKTTRNFFQTVQNKLHFAVHRHTAAEIIVERADSNKTHMGLTTWKDAPDGKIQKFDVSVAKNYLSEKEINFLNRLVTMYLDYAEIQAENKVPMTMADWAKRLDGFLEFNGKEILIGKGRISHEEAKLYSETEFEKYRIVQDKLFESDFDRVLKQLQVNSEGTDN
jgi:hypothetical protein